MEKHESETPHPTNHNLRYARSTQGQRENRLSVTIPKLLILGPEILLHSLDGRCRVTGTVPIQALCASWQGRAPWSTSTPRLLPTKASLGSEGSRCLWEKHRVAKWDTELRSQLRVPHQGGEQHRGMLGRKQWAARENRKEQG